MLVFQRGKNLGIGKIEKYAPQKCLTFGVHIFMGKTGRENKAYSAKFKINVITDVRENRFMK